MKIVYIVPHLSTGGMPEYLKNKIEKLKENSEIWVLEKTRESSYNTIRVRIEKLIGEDRIITWGKDQINLCLNMIDQINPDIVHFEEPCEQFVDDFILNHIYRKDRKEMHNSGLYFK